MCVDRLSSSRGISRVVVDQSVGLGRLGVDVAILTGKCDICVPECLTVIECGYSNSLSQMNIIGAVDTIDDIRPDILHSHFYPADICGAICADRSLHLMHCHGATLRRGRPAYRVGADYLRVSVGNVVGLARCREAIAISDFVRDGIVRCPLPRTVPKISTIYNGIDCSVFPPSRKNAARHKVTEKWKTPILISIGALSEGKGQRDLISAVARLRNKNIQSSLLLVGRTGSEDRSYDGRLREHAMSLGVDDTVFFLGDITEAEKVDLLLGSDIYVTGTRWEGFGLPIIEAFAAGIPVVCYSNSALRELVDDSVTGFKCLDRNVADLASKTEHLIRNENERVAMGDEARRVAVNKFSIETTCRQIAEKYFELAKLSRR